MVDVREFLWDLKVHVDGGSIAFSAVDWANLERVLSEYNRTYPGRCAFSVSLAESYSVAAHVKHGVADGCSHMSSNGPAGSVVLVLPRFDALGESEKCTDNSEPSVGVGLASPIVGMPVSVRSIGGHPVVFIRN